eukprot:3255348-Amphidinium_carterae.1
MHGLNLLSQKLSGFSTPQKPSGSHRKCPGGRVGTCATGRDQQAVACAQCESGSYEAFGGTCRECDGWQSTTLLILAPFAIIAGLFLLSWAANKDAPVA